MSNEHPIKFVRTLTDSQKKRINEDHAASVVVGSDGKLNYLTETIITPKGLEKENKKIWVVPDEHEQVLTSGETEYLFSEIAHMNIILTNACNLSCTYCYEQHKKDFGRFTEDSLLEAYNFLLHKSKKEYKTFQFFGGEPLIHKDLILNFLEKNKDYLQKNAQSSPKQVVSMITNGLLLSPEFSAKYFSYDFTWILISLDTLNAEIDHRELTQDQIEQILDSIRAIPDHAKHRVWTRCTLSRETASGFEQYVDKIYELGVKAIIVHPLILDSTQGFIKWSDSEWNNLHKNILHVLNKYHDLTISFSEGVGKKGENNCMIGSDMIAIDGSGDFSGCYFFTNQKGGPTNKTILGNVFNDTVYIDRYHEFQKNFMQMFEEEEQCKTCNYKDACYQCPAGNLDTGSRMFRPDDMCQKIVKLYLDLQSDVVRKQYANKYAQIMKSVAEDGEGFVFSKSLYYLMFVMFSSRHPHPDEDRSSPEVGEEELCAIWKRILVDKTYPDTTNFSTFVRTVPYDCSQGITIKDLYEFMLNKLELPKGKSQEVTTLTLESRVGYLTLLHFLVFNNKNKSLQGSLTEKMLEQ